MQEKCHCVPDCGLFCASSAVCEHSRTSTHRHRHSSRCKPHSRPSCGRKSLFKPRRPSVQSSGRNQWFPRCHHREFMSYSARDAPHTPHPTPHTSIAQPPSKPPPALFLLFFCAASKLQKTELWVHQKRTAIRIEACSFRCEDASTYYM